MTVLRILLAITVVLAAIVAAILFSGNEVSDVAGDAMEEIVDTTDDAVDAVTPGEEAAPEDAASEEKGEGEKKRTLPTFSIPRRQTPDAEDEADEPGTEEAPER